MTARYEPPVLEEIGSLHELTLQASSTKTRTGSDTLTITTPIGTISITLPLS